MSCLMTALLGAQISLASDIEVQVQGADGSPVANVVVFIKQAGVATRSLQQPEPAVMDQRDMSFVPHILVIERGTAVEFPNSDVVAHHVYSFSRPNNFVLPLYKGNHPEPVVLNHDGIVTLGCNIHDSMLGYIVVVDTDIYGLTDAQGRITFAVNDAASGYEIEIWSPRIRDKKESMRRQISKLPEDVVTFSLKKSLRRAHADKSETVQWDAY
jgi:plastocyanin